MAEDLGTLLLRVGITGAGTTRSEIRGVGDEAINTGRKVRAGAADIRSAEIPIVSLGDSATILASSIGAVATAAAALSGVRIAAQFQQLEIGFETLLGSKVVAKTVLKDLRELGAATPFNTQELIAYSRALLATGANARTLKPELKAIVDTAAALGLQSGDIGAIIRQLSQIRAQPIAQMGQLNDLASFGINLDKIIGAAQARNLPTGGGIRALEGKSGQEAYDTIIKGMERAFPDAARRLAGGSLLGIIQNLGESLQNVFLPTGERLLPVLGAAAGLVSTVVGWIGKLNEVTGGGAGLILIVYGLVRAKAILVGSYIAAIQQVRALTVALAALAATSRTAAATSTVQAAANASAGAAGGFGRFQGKGGIIATIAAIAVGALASFIPDKRIRGTVQDTAMGAGIGAMFGPQGALIGGILGLGKGIFENFFSGSGNTAQERTARAAEDTARTLKEINLRAVGGGPRTNSVLPHTEVEMAMARVMATGIA